MRVLLLTASAALTTVLLAACATEPVPQQGQQQTASSASSPGDNANQMVCTREYPIGTNIPVTKCRTREQIEADKRTATESLNKIQRGGPGATKGG
jgi:hypothetical protein